LSAHLEPVRVDDEANALLVLFGRPDTWAQHAEFNRFVNAVNAQLSGFLQRNLLHAQLLERERLAGLGTAAAMFAHEVGNPLNSMYLHAQLLSTRLGKLEAPENVGQGMRAILDEIKRLTTLLEEFRSMSRKRPLALEEVDVRGLVTRVLDTHVREYAGAEISVNVDLPKTLPAVHADPHKLVQVFLNLCKNSVEAMTEGGTLSVHGRARGKSLIIRIRDTGPGLPKGVDVFQLFKTTKPHGTGLGLPVVQQIVVAHGGSVKARSVPEKGAEFIVTLPVQGP
jgi:signal transduction histidine kinase